MGTQFETVKRGLERDVAARAEGAKEAKQTHREILAQVAPEQRQLALILLGDGRSTPAEILKACEISARSGSPFANPSKNTDERPQDLYTAGAQAAMSILGIDAAAFPLLSEPERLGKPFVLDEASYRAGEASAKALLALCGAKPGDQ